jgi:ABC-type multidrug transport system ATPase subunit
MVTLNINTLALDFSDSEITNGTIELNYKDVYRKEAWRAFIIVANNNNHYPTFPGGESLYETRCFYTVVCPGCFRGRKQAVFVA